jgi:hypothetical protein
LYLALCSSATLILHHWCGVRQLDSVLVENTVR